MAARFAVATGNWTAAIWAATSGGAAGSAAVPTNADDVTINKNVTVTVDDTTAVALTLTLSNGTTGADVGGIIQFSTAANSKLTLERNITTTRVGTAGYMSSFYMDVSASNTYKAELVLNNSGSTTDALGHSTIYGNYLFKGFARKRHSVTNGALTANSSLSVVVANATNWQVGDTLVFATTSAYNATPRTDLVTIATITPGAGTTATVTWTDGAGTGGAVLYDHATDCPVGNFTSNCRILSNGTAGTRSALTIGALDNQMSADGYVDHVEFYKVSQSGSNTAVLGLNLGALSTAARHEGLTNCAFFEFTGIAQWINYAHSKTPRNNHVFYSAQASATCMNAGNLERIYGAGPDEDYVIFRAQNGIQNIVYPDQHQRRHKISGCVISSGGNSGTFSCYAPVDIEDCDFWSNGEQIRPGATGIHFKSCRFGNKVFPDATVRDGHLEIQFGGYTKATDCEFPTSGLEIFAVGTETKAALQIINRDGDAAVQELYQSQSTTIPAIQRNTATINRSTSSMEFTLNSTVAQEWAFEALAKAGETIRLLCYVQIGSTYDDAAYTYPSITVSGLGITPVSASSTSASIGAWELLTLDATNTGSADGNLTVTLSAQSATANAKAYFSGIPASPFVSRCRHYGYLFNETSPTREVNPTIDTGVSEATALAYGNSGTDLEVTWNTAPTPSTTAIKVSTTFKKLYHFTQADGCLNVGSAMPLTGAGLDDSPALFAAGNVTVSDGAVLNGSGSISMGAYTLATEFASGVNYTYTGGTFSQATTVPTFSGGTLNIGAAGTYTYVQAAAMILSMTPTAPGTYALGETTFTGEVDLRNTAAHAITVELPTGASYTTASNTGGTITVSLPVVTADISITSMPDAGAVPTRLQIINSTATGASTWVANTVYATGAIVKRTTGLGSESTAGLYFRATTGGTSHATTEPTWDTTVGNTTADNTVVWTTYAILYYDDDPAATSLTDTYIDGEEFLDGESVEVRFAEMDGSTSFKTYSTTAVVNSAGFSVLVSEDADDVYATNALDGSDYESTFSPNFTLDYMVLDTNTDFAGKAAFAYYCYTLTTSAGMWGFWGGVTALDEGNYRVNTAILNLYFDESAGFVKQTDNVRIFRDDGLRPAIDPTTGGHGIEINWRTPVSVVSTGGSAVLPQDIVDIAAASGTAAATATLAAAQTTPIHSDVRKVNSYTVDGNGQTGTEWGPA